MLALIASVLQAQPQAKSSFNWTIWAIVLVVLLVLLYMKRKARKSKSR
jgi:hydrogenase-4 membrane subunit HyfE